MCGRFTQYFDAGQVAETLGASVWPGHEPRYNVAQSDDVLVCKLTPWHERVLETMHWGLIPAWAESDHSKYKLINARAETVAEKPAFRHAFRKQRCLIPASGFYEWTQANGKQPYYIQRADRTPLYFAGLWEHWKDPQGHGVDSCTIIVCPANRRIARIHERMPVILEEQGWEPWLAEDTAPDRLKALLIPYPAEDLTFYPVSRELNNPRHDTPALIKPVTL